MDLKDFYDPRVLNIFCDASIRKRGDTTDGCYGAIIVCGDEIIDQIYQVCSDSTNNNAEIKAIRAGVLLAIRYGTPYTIINLFSDSQISILGIRDRFFSWKCKNNTLYGYSDEPIKNQEVYVEIVSLMNEYQTFIRFWHQKGHVKNSSYKDLVEAVHVFSASNSIRNNIDINLIRFISKYNDLVDKRSRSLLYQTDIYKMKYISPISFVPVNFYSMTNQYNNRNIEARKK